MKNVLSIFESRINDIFTHGGTGTAPITFKKLAKRTVREMENETFVIDGVDTAPALYTVLVSSADDRVMRPLYVNITEEISSLVEAQAKKRGYSFVGKPLVRFMIDPSLKPGKFAVFAENIDPRTLARLREEENAFLGVEQQVQEAPKQAPRPEEDGFSIIPEDSIPLEPDVEGQEPAPEAVLTTPPEDVLEPDAVPPEISEASLEGAKVPQEDSQQLEEVPQPDVQPEEAPAVPDVSTEPQPSPDTPSEGSAEPRPERDADTPASQTDASCTLTDQQTGKVYTITSAVTPIGREHLPGGIVLRDPNVSRRHAELTYDGQEWHIHDLNSTNGTLVNDIDIEECSLRDGDVLTIGLLNFVFREH